MRVLGFRPLSILSTLAPALLLGATPAHAETTGVDTDDTVEYAVQITSPLNMAGVGDAPAEFTVDVLASGSGLFGTELELLVDGVALEEVCADTSTCMFDVELTTPGEHTLEVRLLDVEIVLASDDIIVLVGTPVDGNSSSSDDGGGGGGADEGGGGSKGCSVDASGSSGAAMGGALLMLALGAGSRRRRSRS
ncbi:MAG: hypothetical protein K0V04_26450 [Deltaproteobacteria bacterium]|nr:hypothetical protein [Deltaproteobacteria bacterium]